MRDFPPGWATDLAVLKYSGSIVEDHGDHLLVRTPNNPDFHWGNFLFVTDDDSVNDAAKWVTAFRSALPEANWVAIGLIQMPDDEAAWVAQGLDLELADVLTTSTPMGTRCAASAGRTGRSQLPGMWPRTCEPMSTKRSPMSDSQERSQRRNVRFQSATWEPGLGHSRTIYSSPIWVSSGAVRRRATRASAPTTRASVPPPGRCRSVGR
jgi:hypothetical protein